MKLFNILFEETKQRIDYGNPIQFALLVSDNRFVLIDKQQYIKHLTTQDKLDVAQYLAAWAKCENKHTDDCNGAVEINYIVASPYFKGAGTAMHKIISKYYKKPIISDRDNWDTDLSKQAWKRTETNPEFKKLELDNYGEKWRNGKRIKGHDHYYDSLDWFDIKGHWPNRVIDVNDKPKTIDNEKDDCMVPDESDYLPKKLDQVLGTADAYLYTGPINTEALIDSFDNLLDDMETMYDVQISREALTKAGYDMFADLYPGAPV